MDEVLYINEWLKNEQFVIRTIDSKVFKVGDQVGVAKIIGLTFTIVSFEIFLEETYADLAYGSKNSVMSVAINALL